MRPLRIESQRRFPVSAADGYAYITDPLRWPEYWPRFVRLDPDSRWRTPGDRARITLRLLGREVELDMTLERIEPGKLVEYTSVQRGLPAARHRRHFDESGGELDYRVVVEYSLAARVAGHPGPNGRAARDRAHGRRDPGEPRPATQVGIVRRAREGVATSRRAAGGSRRAAALNARRQHRGRQRSGGTGPVPASASSRAGHGRAPD